MSEWTFDPDDFAALWYNNANDRFPSPLHYSSRFLLRDEFEAHRVAVSRRYPADELERIQLATHTLTTSDIRIEVLGGTTRHKARDGSFKMYRIVGARNQFQAVTLYQTTTDDQDGPIKMRLCRPESLVSYLVKSIPPCRPGSQPPETFHPDDLRARHGEYFEDVARNTPRERFHRLLQRPADGGGSAGLFAGAINTMPAAWNVVQWHDITRDGRYTELRGSHISVQPTRSEDLVTRLTGWVGDALHRLAEDDADSW
ncbi:ESX secretion-associated protein EspG [Nocardia callitridis]|uniref:ESX secretion-associated protein EspG n=1 Tax=Nocardia callitridis TaxID=648753 RepID=A0ABP9KJZ0_9NOCA